MSWDALPPEIRDTARRVCTPQELEVVRLAAHGYGRRAGARALGISEEAWRWRLDRASAKIREQMGDAWLDFSTS